jgi:hypothetical protein
MGEVGTSASGVVVLVVMGGQWIGNTSLLSFSCLLLFFILKVMVREAGANIHVQLRRVL